LRGHRERTKFQASTMLKVYDAGEGSPADTIVN
jgi:hypothetical protein